MGDTSPSPIEKKIPSGRIKIFLGMIIGMIIVSVVCIILFHYYQSIVSYASLQGYWKINTYYYLLISDHMIRIIQLTDDNPITIYNDDKIVINYKSIIPTSSYSYEIVRSNTDKINIASSSKNPFNSKVLQVTLFPANGIIDISDGDSSARLVKDNEMTIAHLSSI